MEQATFNSIGLVVLAAVLTFVASVFWNSRANRQHKADALREEELNRALALKLEEENKATALKATSDAMASRVRDLETQLATLTATFTPISAAFQAVLIKQLTHYHTPEMDKLLEKATKQQLTPDEKGRLMVLLLERTKDPNGRISDSEREAALMLPMVMNRVSMGASVVESEVMVVLVPKEFGEAPAPVARSITAPAPVVAPR